MSAWRRHSAGLPKSHQQYIESTLGPTTSSYLGTGLKKKRLIGGFFGLWVLTMIVNLLFLGGIIVGAVFLVKWAWGA